MEIITKFNFIDVFCFETVKSLISETEILRLRTKDVEVKKYCVSLLEKFGSFAYTRKTLDELVLGAKKEIERLGGNPLLDEILDEFCNWKQADREE